MPPDLDSWLAWRKTVLSPPAYAPSGYDARDYIRDLLDFMQDGHCAMCLTLATLRWELDHDHETDLVRGLLCPRCNNREAAALRRELSGGPPAHPVIAAYRANPPASGTGWVYWGPAAPDWTHGELSAHKRRLRRTLREIAQQASGRQDEQRLLALAFATWSGRLPVSDLPGVRDVRREVRLRHLGILP